MVSNVFSFYGYYDLILGTLANFFASYVAYMLSRYKGIMSKILATITSCIVVIFFIGVLLFHLVIGMPLISSLIGISVGSFISIILFGTILLVALEGVYN